MLMNKIHVAIWPNALCRRPFIETVSLTRDTDGLCTAECESGDCCAEVRQENFPVLKQEPDDVCCIVCFIYSSMYVGEFLTLD